MNDYNYNEQYAEWLQQHCGKFSASEIYKLLVSGREPMTEQEIKEEKAKGGKRTTKDTYFGEGALTYIRTKLAEILTGIVVDLEGIAAMEWGNSQELDAVLLFEKEAGLRVDYYGKANPKFFQYTEFSGSSPDGLIDSDDAIIEVKCPQNSGIHVQYLFIESPAELEKEKKDFYAQIQMNLLCTGKAKAYFVSYDPRISIASLRLKILTIYRDEPFIENLKERISEAEKYLKVLYASLDEKEMVTN